MALNARISSARMRHSATFAKQANSLQLNAQNSAKGSLLTRMRACGRSRNTAQQDSTQQEARMSDLPPSRRQPAPRVTDLSTISDLFVVIQYLDLRVDGEFTTKTLQPHLGTKLVGTAGFPFVNMKSATERLDAIAKRSNILTRIGDGHWKLATMPAEWQAKLDDAAEASPSRTITTPRAAAASGGMSMTT